jgi:ABC-type multidrug transport system fused ATPase/permease subunit
MPNKEEKFTWRDAWGMLRGSFKGTGGFYVGILFFILVAAVGQVAEPLLYGKIVDEIVAAVAANGISSLAQNLMYFVLLWAGAALLGTAAKEFSQWLSYKAGNKVWDQFSHVALKRVLDWDPERFGRVSLGALAKRLDRAGEASWEIAARAVVDIVPTLVTFVVFFVVGLVLDWRMTLISLATVPVLLILTIFAYRWADKRQEDLNEAWEDVSRKLYEIVANIVPIKSFVAEKRMLREYTHLIDVGLVRQTRLNTVWTTLDFFNSATRFVARFFTLAAGIYFISQGTLSLGVLVAFLGMMTYILAPFDYLLADILRRTSETKNAFARLKDDWYAERKVAEIAKPIHLKELKGELVFDKVSYRYKGSNNDVLSNVSLHVKAGTSLAIVGPSGGGKSTLVRMINRFLDPTSGALFLDGVNVKDADIDELRRSVGVVHQDTVMFNESILENIKFAKPSATKDDVIAACKKAQAHEFITRMTNGYDTIVGERGARLSGGERQRLALARVFLADAPILILDESTSALDSETEAKLQAALTSAMKGRTTVIIAHRLSTVYMAEQIAVIEKGSVVELGTHDELLAEGGLYEKLWRLQSGGYLPD